VSGVSNHLRIFRGIAEFISLMTMIEVASLSLRARRRSGISFPNHRRQREAFRQRELLQLRAGAP